MFAARGGLRDRFYALHATVRILPAAALQSMDKQRDRHQIGQNCMHVRPIPSQNIIILIGRLVKRVAGKSEKAGTIYHAQVNRQMPRDPLFAGRLHQAGNVWRFASIAGGRANSSPSETGLNLHRRSTGKLIHFQQRLARPSATIAPHNRRVPRGRFSKIHTWAEVLGGLKTAFDR